MVDCRLLLLCLFLYFDTVKSNGILCQVGFCETYRNEEGCVNTAEQCAINNSTHQGLWMASPTTCNCCDYCLPVYGENEYCSTGGPGTGFTVGRCGAGLTCVADPDGGHSYCARMTTECHGAQDEFDARLERGEVGALEMRPLCDDKGQFATFDCVPTQTCFCRSESGERLFGEALYLGESTIRNMHCGCALIHDKINKNISPGVPIPVVGPRCTSDGNFNPVQCLNRTCYCVDKATGAIVDGQNMMVDLDIHPIADLACYDEDLDLFPNNVGEPPYNYSTPCINEILGKAELITRSREDGYNVDYFSSVSPCMPDGSYGRILTTSSGDKICADERGQQIQDYQAKPNTEDFDNMDCKCAQTFHIMGSSPEKPVCCKNGNFRRIQCRRGLCRCVDSDGRQTSRENANVSFLPCYTPTWKSC